MDFYFWKWEALKILSVIRNLFSLVSLALRKCQLRKFALSACYLVPINIKSGKRISKTIPCFEAAENIKNVSFV